ncbi:MAG TPA: SAM-dependent DNA methyltransferase [Bosea sp. (in: a-proteobacteria)]|nr:SAM-dependent DNA methyltransferase [Bosea sp. (in: a-proteobacteria)]
MKISPNAVMQSRATPMRGLDFFPTPPWATRAFLHDVLQPEFPARLSSAWEPAAGEGHMAHVLGEVFEHVRASDVADYGSGFEVGSFVGQGLDVAPARPVDWIITNPPFNLAVDFAERALTEAGAGAALLLRTSWMEGAERYNRLFRDRPPRVIAQYCERVPMIAGRWDPAAASATSYAWFVWHLSSLLPETKLVWIPPGAKARHWRDDDLKRWAQ